MTRNETENVKIGDIITITHVGKNYRKRGTVKSLKVDGRVGIFIEPLDCEFEFSSECDRRYHTAKDGLYIWPYRNLKIDNKEVPKIGDILTNEEIKTILKIANRFGCDRDGDILKIFVKCDSGNAMVIQP